MVLLRDCHQVFPFSFLINLEHWDMAIERNCISSSQDENCCSICPGIRHHVPVTILFGCAQCTNWIREQSSIQIDRVHGFGMCTAGFQHFIVVLPFPARDLASIQYIRPRVLAELQRQPVLLEFVASLQASTHFLIKHFCVPRSKSWFLDPSFPLFLLHRLMRLPADPSDQISDYAFVATGQILYACTRL